MNRFPTMGDGADGETDRAVAAQMVADQATAAAADADAAAATYYSGLAAASLAAAQAALYTLQANGLLGTVTPNVAAYFGVQNPTISSEVISGMTVPATTKAAAAGSMALANQIGLAVQAGQLSQAKAAAAMAALTPPIQ